MCQLKLFEIIDTCNALCLGFCLGKGRKEHASQNGDDGNDDQ